MDPGMPRDYKALITEMARDHAAHPERTVPRRLADEFLLKVRWLAERIVARTQPGAKRNPLDRPEADDVTMMAIQWHASRAFVMLATLSTQLDEIDKGKQLKPTYQPSVLNPRHVRFDRDRDGDTEGS